MRVSVDDLHPSQMSVGYLEVHEKQNRLHQMKKKELDDYLYNHKVPVVLGIDKKMFIIDHHHLCMAAHNLGLSHVYVEVLEDWSHLSEYEFWSAMKKEQYVWMYDENGNEIPNLDYSKYLPSSIKGCKDDPYRSIAGFVRKAGGFQKSMKPFAEFVWANFFRKKLPLPNDVSTVPECVISSAINLARSPLASNLPGFDG